MSSILVLSAVAITQPCCLSSLASYSDGLGEVSTSWSGAYDQSLEALLSQSAAYENESRVPDRSHVHTHDHDGSEAPDELPDPISNGPSLSGSMRPLLHFHTVSWRVILSP
ncbi:hypothetical protein Tco_0859335 [Tanacetum coccineum]|uniref:Secreted protein n=1 Tax=Tanacetum coccineum TaxID=301880 RepID=A0ABQ5BCP9_9ASTR